MPVGNHSNAPDRQSSDDRYYARTRDTADNDNSQSVQCDCSSDAGSEAGC